jgi:hypothetical protein
MTLPTADGSANQVLKTDGSGTLAWVDNGGGGAAIQGSSITVGSAAISEAELETIDGVTAGTVAASKAVVVDANKDVTGFRNVTLTGEADAATLDISGNSDLDGTLLVGSDLSLDGSNKELRFYEGANYVGFEAPALTADKIWVLPTADGSADQVLKTDGSGTLGWATAGSGSLSQVTENSKTGSRLSTATAANYGNIGTKAVDLSYSASTSSTRGATGDYSFAMGEEVTASGSRAVAIGEFAEATGNTSIALGYVAKATGSRAFATGESTTASGNFSAVMGQSTTASGTYSIATGYSTEANGTASFSMGKETEASDFGSLVIGTYNSVGNAVTANGSASAFDVDNSAFVIGNGTSLALSDAFVVYSNGNATLTGELDAATLDVSGNADIDGITNLDAVDIDGAVQLDGTLTVGVDDTGDDVKFFGATSGAYLLWDESDNSLETAGVATINIVKDKLLIGGTAVTTTAAELNILDGVTSTAAEINIIDGGTSASATTIVDADRVVLNDNSTMKQVAMTDIKTYISSNTYPFVLAELDAAQETTSSATAIGLNTTALVSLGSVFSINASDYIQTSEAGYYEVSANTTWFKDGNASRYLIFQIQKSSDGSSWSDVDGGRFIATAPSATPTYAFGAGRAAVQLSADDMIRVTVKEDQGSSGTLYLRSSGIDDAYPGDTTIMVKKIG